MGGFAASLTTGGIIAGIWSLAIVTSASTAGLATPITVGIAIFVTLAVIFDRKIYTWRKKRKHKSIKKEEAVAIDDHKNEWRNKREDLISDDNKENDKPYQKRINARAHEMIVACDCAQLDLSGCPGYRKSTGGTFARLAIKFGFSKGHKRRAAKKGERRPLMQSCHPDHQRNPDPVDYRSSDYEEELARDIAQDMAREKRLFGSPIDDSYKSQEEEKKSNEDINFDSW